MLARVEREEPEHVVPAYAYEDVANVQPEGLLTAHLPAGISKDEVITAARERRVALMFPKVDSKGGFFYNIPLRVDETT